MTLDECVRTHINNSISEVPLLPKEDVGCPGNEATHSHVGQKVMLLQRHVGQTEVSLTTEGQKGYVVSPSHT